MKKTLLGLACVAAFVAFLFAPVVAIGDPAVVIKDSGCGLIDGDGGFAFANGGDITVSTSSGNTVLKCKATGVANSTGSAVHWDNANTGYFCGTFGGATIDWSETVSASGQAMLTCKVRN